MTWHSYAAPCSASVPTSSRPMHGQHCTKLHANSCGASIAVCCSTAWRPPDCNSEQAINVSTCFALHAGVEVSKRLQGAGPERRTWRLPRRRRSLHCLAKCLAPRLARAPGLASAAARRRPKTFVACAPGSIAAVGGGTKSGLARRAAGGLTRTVHAGSAYFCQGRSPTMDEVCSRHGTGRIPLVFKSCMHGMP